MACYYSILGCDVCDISECENRDIIIQLAEWLEELKTLRYCKDKWNENQYQQGRADAIDEFYAKCREEYWYSSQFMVFFEMTRKKLKAKGEE